MPYKWDHATGRPMEGTIWQPPVPKPEPEANNGNNDDGSITDFDYEKEVEPYPETDEQEAARLKKEAAEYAEQEAADAAEDVRGLPYDPN